MLAHFQDLYPLHTEEARERHLFALLAHLLLSAEVVAEVVACLCYQEQRCYTTRRMASEFRFCVFPHQYNWSLPAHSHSSHRNASSAGVHFHKLYNSTSSIFLCLPECAITIDSIIIGSSSTSLKNTKKMIGSYKSKLSLYSAYHIQGSPFCLINHFHHVTGFTGHFSR